MSTPEIKRVTEDIREAVDAKALDETGRRALTKELASAVSTQAQVANRTWLGLTTVALFALVPRVPTKDGNVSLPFGLGEVEPVWFHAVVFAILVILVIAFAAAHTQQVRAQKLAQSVVDRLVEAGSSDHVHPREFFDMVRTPSQNRVAPLAQALRGKYQFFATSGDCPWWLRLASVVYFVLLKVASLTVYFGLPGWALWRTYYGLSMSSGLHAVATAGFFISAFCFLQLLWSDVAYTVTILKKLW